MRHFFVCYFRLLSWVKCHDYWLKSSLAEYVVKGSVQWKGRPGMQMYGGVYTEGVILLNTSKMAAWGNKRKSAINKTKIVTSQLGKIRY